VAVGFAGVAVAKHREEPQRSRWAGRAATRRDSGVSSDHSYYDGMMGGPTSTQRETVFSAGCGGIAFIGESAARRKDEGRMTRTKGQRREGGASAGRKGFNSYHVDIQWVMTENP